MSNGSRYSRRHYEDIARLLGTQPTYPIPLYEEYGLEFRDKTGPGYIANDLDQRFIQLFAADNPAFDPQRFLNEIHNTRVRAGMLEGLA